LVVPAEATDQVLCPIDSDLSKDYSFVYGMFILYLGGLFLKENKEWKRAFSNYVDKMR